MNKLFDFVNRHAIEFVLAVIGMIAAAILGYFIYDALAHGGKIKVILSPVPKDATVTIDGKQTSERTLYLEPKKYTFAASKDGYESYSENVQLEEGQGETYVTLSLYAQSKEAEKEQEKNQEDYLKNEGIAGKQANVDGRRFREKNPIVNKLPYQTLLYTIGYRADNTDPTGMSIIIEIKASEGRRADVVAQIERWGFDPTKLNIHFQNYRNPFDEV